MNHHRNSNFTVFALILCVFCGSKSSNAVQLHLNDKQGQDITPFLLNFVGVAYSLSGLAHQWLTAQFGFTDDPAEEISLPDDEQANAQIALNEILQHHNKIKVSMTGLLSRLEALPIPNLINVIAGKGIRPEIRFLAEKVMRTRHVLPLLEQGRYDEVGDLNRAFLRATVKNRGAGREIASRLFRFEHPNPEVELTEPTILEFHRINLGVLAPRDVLRTWSKGAAFPARTKAVKTYEVGEDTILQELQIRVIELEVQMREHKHPTRELFELVHQVHTAILFFESILHNQNDENDQPPRQPSGKTKANDQVKAALATKGSDRFPISGQLENDALFMGFVQDAALLSQAALNDVSDGAHRLKKGGGERYIRGSLVISRDRQEHAGGAYKIHHESKGVWKYVDTAILVEVENRFMFLCMNRGTKGQAHYWRLVDAEGQWYRLHSNDPNAVLEPIAGPHATNIENQSVAS